MRFEITSTVQERKGPVETIQKDSASDLQKMINFVKSSLIQISYEALKEEQAKGFPKDPIMIVDNVVGKRLEDVKPFGKVEFTTRKSPQLLFLEMFEYLNNLQRVVTGAYKNATFISVNGKVIASNPQELRAYLSDANSEPFKAGDTVRIYSTAPYAGMLERQGFTSKNPGSNVKKLKSRDRNRRRQTQRFSDGLVRRANGAFFLTARSFSRRFGAQYFINFEFANGPDLGITTGTRPHGVGRGLRYKPRRNFDKRNPLYKGPYAYPSIRIYVRQ